MSKKATAEINGEKAASRFLELLNKGILRQHLLPNSAEEYSLRQEQLDLDHFRKFLCTSAYDEVRLRGVDTYAGEQI